MFSSRHALLRAMAQRTGAHGEMGNMERARGGLARAALVKEDDLQGTRGDAGVGYPRIPASAPRESSSEGPRRTLYFVGSKNERSFASQPPPGPPCRKTTY